MTHSQIFLFLRRGKKRVLPKPGPSIPRDFNFKKVKSPTVHGLTFQIGHGPSMSRSVNATVHKSPNSTRSLGPAEHWSKSNRNWASISVLAHVVRQTNLSIFVLTITSPVITIVVEKRHPQVALGAKWRCQRTRIESHQSPHRQVLCKGLKKVFDSLTSDGFLAVGSWSPDNIKAELYAFDTNAWADVEDYPFVIPGSRITDYSMIFIPETSSYLVIGGTTFVDYVAVLSQIAIFANDTWYDAGRLNSVRRVSCRLLLFVP